MILQQLKKFFAWETLLKPEEPRGEIPDSRELYGRFLRMAWPSVVEAVLVCFVGIADTIMVGTLGDEAIAAVGITQQPKFVLLCFIFALNIGITATVARRKGEGNQAEANHVMRNGFFVGLCMILVLSAVGYLLADKIMLLVGAKYLDDSVAYFRIIIFSVIFQSMNTMINAAQKGSGNTRISMSTNLVGNLINGIWIFPRLEIRGAAIATVIGTAVSFLMAFIRLLEKDKYINLFYPAPWKMSAEVLKPVFKVGGSALVEQLCIRIGFLLFAMIVAYLPGLDYTTHTIAINILSISFFFGDGFQVAATSLAGQSLGAKRPDLAYIYCGIGQRVVIITASILSMVFIFLRRPLMMAYTDTPEVIARGEILMLFSAVVTFLQTSNVVYMGCLRGAGDTAYTARASLICIGIVRPLGRYLLAYPLGLGLIGAWIGLTIDQGLRLVFSATRIHKRKWLRIRL